MDEEKNLFDLIFDHPKMAGVLACCAFAATFSPKVSLMAMWICLFTGWVFAAAMIFGIPAVRNSKYPSWIGSGLVFLVGVALISYGMWLHGNSNIPSAEKPVHAQRESDRLPIQKDASVDKSTPPINIHQPPANTRKTIKISKPLVRTPCTPSWAKHEVDYADLPGGPNMQKPVLVLNVGTSPVVLKTVNGDTFVLFELVLTNRGEASIVRNWELCLIRDKKPVIYQAAEIPREGIAIDDSEIIMPAMSLVDNAIKNPIEHAHTAGGWVAFKIPGTEYASNFAFGKEPLNGGVQFKDYLDNPQYFGIAQSGSVNLVDKLPHSDFYVPGSPH